MNYCSIVTFRKKQTSKQNPFIKPGTWLETMLNNLDGCVDCECVSFPQKGKIPQNSGQKKKTTT